MSERLRARDLAFLTAETPTTPRAQRDGRDLRPRPRPGLRLRHASSQLIADRIAFVPRYRQRVQLVPGHLANPVWVDDAHFDIGYHVRRSALPRPGTHGPAARAGRPDRLATAGPQPAAVGDLLRRGARPTAGSRCSPRPTRRWSTASQTVDLGQVLLDTDSGASGASAATSGTRPSGPVDAACWPDAVHDTSPTPYTAVDTVRARRRLAPCATAERLTVGRRQGRRPGSPAAVPTRATPIVRRRSPSSAAW